VRKFLSAILTLIIVASSAPVHAEEESFADSYPIFTFALGAVATIGVTSQIREGFKFSGDTKPIGGYILGGLYAIPPFLPSGGDDNRTQPHKTATAMAFFGLSIYNFIYLTKDDITTDKILVDNLVGFTALMVYLWGISKIFHPIKSYDIGTYVFPSVRMDQQFDGSQKAMSTMNLYIPFN
jgi:hypothetical protein